MNRMRIHFAASIRIRLVDVAHSICQSAQLINVLMQLKYTTLAELRSRFCRKTRHGIDCLRDKNAYVELYRGTDEVFSFALGDTVA
jgi:hypothetical protein